MIENMELVRTYVRCIAMNNW